MPRAIGRAVRGVLLDIDGTLLAGEEAIPGASAAVATLRRRGLAIRCLTNASNRSRVTVCRQLEAAGFDLSPAEVISAPVAVAGWLRRQGSPRCFFLATGDVEEDFLGVRPPAPPLAKTDYVVIGGAEENFTYENMNRAYRYLLGGAKLLAIHRQPSWLTDAGPTLDAGAFIAGLEYATGARAQLFGKPAPALFRQALHDLQLPASAVAMVGDDIRSDVWGAQRVGITGILVRTGKFKPSDLTGRVTPDIVISSIADFPSAILTVS